MNPFLSIIIPAYNEERTLGKLLEVIKNVGLEQHGYRYEVIVVDDGSKDRTAEVAASVPGVTLLQQKNAGKGAAVQAGIKAATGDYILVQDADLEYYPRDYLAMVKELRTAQPIAVYGSRTLAQWQDRGWCTAFPGKHPRQEVGPWLAGLLLSLWTLLLFRVWISDTLTGYKIYPRQFIRQLTVKTKGFETDHEITAKLIRNGIPIVEVPVDYNPRSVDEGKKIKMIDGVIAVLTLLRFRLSS